jgi:hypothetical protein
MTRIKWERAQAGRGSFDERATTEWRRGPLCSEVSDTPDDRIPDLRNPPDIYWAANLGKLYAEENEREHVRVRRAAAQAAQAVYRRAGVNTLVSRTLAFYKRASSRRPFPSAYFSLYFDFAARALALSMIARHDPAPTRNLRRFYSPSEMSNRARGCSSRMVEESGGFPALYKHLSSVYGRGPGSSGHA